VVDIVLLDATLLVSKVAAICFSFFPLILFIADGTSTSDAICQL